MPPAQHRSAAPARLVRRGRRGRLVREGAGEVVPERVEGGRHRTEGPDQCLLVPRRTAATLAAKALVSELGLGPQPRENCAQRVAQARPRSSRPARAEAVAAPLGWGVARARGAGRSCQQRSQSTAVGVAPCRGADVHGKRLAAKQPAEPLRARQV